MQNICSVAEVMTAGGRNAAQLLIFPKLSILLYGVISFSRCIVLMDDCNDNGVISVDRWRLRVGVPTHIVTHLLELNLIE